MTSSPMSYGQMQKNIQDCLQDGPFLDRATVAEAADAMVEVLKQKAFFQYDIVTGMYRVTASEETFRECTEREAQSLFSLIVAPLIRIITTVNMDGGHKARKLTTAEATELWDAVKFANTIDSRIEEYEAIPAWDGTPRIATFMKKYFECECMPNLFLLFMTSVMAKWKSPKAHVPYWFDFVGDAKGCLAGDVKINVYKKVGTNYQQKKVRIARLFDMASNESDTFIVRSFDEQTKKMGYSEAEVIYSGEKQCYLLTTDNGFSIECSGNHRFYTDKGWKNILQLQEGEEIYVNAQFATNRHDKNYRSPAADAKEFYVKFHPVASFDKRKNAHRIREYKAIWEAAANGMTLTEYIDLLNNYDGRPLISVPRGYDIHHKNGDHFDNSIDNLELLTKSEHGKIHGANRKEKIYLAQKVKVKSIVPTDVKKTYDLSCVVGAHNYVANEFITHNTGKSSLFGHLFGERAMILPLPSRQEDLFVSAYTNGALVVCDDECTWIGKAVNKFSYDQFKSVVTMQKDTFSRKHAQPETHDRPFVIVRTSNEPRTVFSTNERRQIIFNVGLGERECRHWDLPEADRIQLLAEAKDYVEKHDGKPYELTKAEEAEVEANNLDNFDTESEGYESILRFLRDLQNRPSDTAIYQIPNPKGYICSRYINYADWCKDNHIKYIDDSRVYNRQMLAIARIYPALVKYTGKKERCGDVISRIARVLPKQKEVEDDIPDMF